MKVLLLVFCFYFIILISNLVFFASINLLLHFLELALTLNMGAVTIIVIRYSLFVFTLIYNAKCMTFIAKALFGIMEKITPGANFFYQLIIIIIFPLLLAAGIYAISSISVNHINPYPFVLVFASFILCGIYALIRVNKRALSFRYRK